MSDPEARARDEGIDRALGGAPVGWQEDALDAVRFLAERRSYLDADDVWEQLEATGARTPENMSALAGVLKQASGRLAWIEATDRSRKSERDGRHRSRIMVWRSLICGSQTPEALAWRALFRPPPPPPEAPAPRPWDYDQRRGGSGYTRRR